MLSAILQLFMRMNLLVLGAAALSFAACFYVRAEGKDSIDVSKLPPPSDKQGVTYASDIKPIFDHSCVKCHTGPKAKGKLHLDSLEGTLNGSEDGKVIKPGKSAESVLVHNIAHLGEEEDFMPPPKNKAGIGPLTNEQIGLIRAWIDQGAK
jgi:Planctomycete cytochrome C